MIEKKVYSSYAFKEKCNEKYKMNLSIYNEIKDKAVIEIVSSGYANKKIKVTVKENETLTEDEKALIADSGNLCFGYRKECQLFVIYTD